MMKLVFVVGCFVFLGLAKGFPQDLISDSSTPSSSSSTTVNSLKVEVNSPRPDSVESNESDEQQPSVSNPSSIHHGPSQPDSPESEENNKNVKPVVLPARIPDQVVDSSPLPVVATLPPRRPPTGWQPPSTSVAPTGEEKREAPVAPPRGAPIPIALSPQQNEDRKTSTVAPSAPVSPFLQGPRAPMSLLNSLDDPEFKYFLDLVTKNKMEDMFQVRGPVSLFLPNQAALSTLDSSITSNTTALERFFKSLLVTWPYSSEKLKRTDQIYTLDGNPIYPRVVIKNGKEEIYLNGARLTEKRDIPAPYKGYIQVIDSLLLPLPDGNIADVIQMHEDWSKFAQFMASTNILNNPLKRNEGYTVLIPPNGIVTKISNDKFQEYTSDPEKLADLLQRHIISEVLYSASLTPQQNIKALNEEVLNIKVEKGNKITINGIGVTQADIPATNGVIYLIDNIIPVAQTSDVESSRKAA